MQKGYILVTIFVDLDGTICTEERTFERPLAKPIPGARENLQKLVDQGHTIVVYSARSWSELRVTEQWLKDHEIPFHSIHLGKPIADYWIDDRAIPFKNWEQVMADLPKKKH